MDGWTDGWKASFCPQRPLLYDICLTNELFYMKANPGPSPFLGSSLERLDAIVKGTEGFQFKVRLGRTSTYIGYPMFFFKEFSFGATVVTIHRKM